MAVLCTPTRRQPDFMCDCYFCEWCWIMSGYPL
jgi:hypothetical protein